MSIKQNENNQDLPKEYLAISPLDGRYHEIGECLSPYFSEFAYMKYRTKIEVYWLKFLIEQNIDSEILRNFDKSKIPQITSIYENFSAKSMKRIKEFEYGAPNTPATRHDVKSVELFVAEKLKAMGMNELVSFVHFGCTSEDINNTAYASMIKDAMNNVWILTAEKLILKLSELAKEYKSIPMLAHTHGQPATPTTLGKELSVFVFRLKNELEKIKKLKTYGKFNGATGNYAALTAVFPNEDWMDLSKKFVEEYLELSFNPITTQIESHDYICELADHIRHFGNILQGLDKDIWTYVSMEYLKQIPVGSEVGSSTMPHKINPINFENSEANINISNALLESLSRNLSMSRMQRDLTDSSSLRNLGMSIGYSIQAIEQTCVGLNKIAVNEERLESDLNENYEVLAEAIQTMLRKYGIPDAYNKLKTLTRGNCITKENLQEFILSLPISKEDKDFLLNLKPSTYIGIAEKLVDKVLNDEI